MKIDAAQYAGISAQMSQTNSFLEIKEFTNDYLDKPPLLFWLSSISIKIFGTNNFAYKLPSFLFLLLSLFAVYSFALLYYLEKVAKNALLILASTQAYFLMTNDVRTDALLTSSVIISIWLFAEYFEKKKLKYLIIAPFFTALALMSKGPIGIIAVLLPIIFHLLYLKKWYEIFSFRWALVFSIIALLLVPMSYGLYTQFDLHPEKISYGIKGQSGLYFYYWLQSFGRITGENIWNNNKPWHFFLASSLWDFFPWFLPLVFAIFYKLKRLFFHKKKAVEIICLSGFIMIFMMLSMSKYKLPHYVFVTFPFAAILVADYFSLIGEKSWRNWRLFYVILSILILLLIISSYVFFFTEINIWLFVCVILHVFTIYTYFYKPQNNIAQLLFLTIMLNVFLTFEFYPKLLNFQADSAAAKYVFQKLKNENVYLYNAPSHSFSFYTKKPFVKIITKKQFQEVKNSFWVYLSKEELAEIKNLDLKITRKISFQDYPITQLKINFLLANKRQNELKHKFLIKIENNK
jgi:4-amino-4-deoxy-L-arabinose transferase-like glycosyltransferase